MPPSVRPRSLTLALFVFALAACSALVFLRPGARVYNWPVIDDGYYALSVSHYLADGQGLTIDGTHPTNGFQPLWVVLCAPLFWLAHGNLETAVRLVLVLAWITWLAWAALAGALARRVLGPAFGPGLPSIFLVAMLLQLASVFAFGESFNGLETALAAAFVAGALLYYFTLDHRAPAAQIGCGLLLGLMVLARVDTAILVVFLACARLFRPGPLAARLAGFLRISVPAFLVSSPWWAYNLLQFGHLMPSSGRALQDWHFSVARFETSFHSLLVWFTSNLYVPRWDGLLLSLVRLLVLAAALFLVRHRLKKISATLDRSAREALACAALYFIFLALWYPAYSWATFFYPRYLAGALLFSTLLWTAVFLELYPRAPRLLSLALPALLLLRFATFSLTTDQPGALAYSPCLADQLPLVLQHVPADERVAAGQTGTLGFLRPNVVNLDGRVNADALAYQNDMPAYLRQSRIRWVADRADLIDERHYLGPDPAAAGWKLVARQNDFVLYEYAPIPPAR